MPKIKPQTALLAIGLALATGAAFLTPPAQAAIPTAPQVERAGATGNGIVLARKGADDTQPDDRGGKRKDDKKKKKNKKKGRGGHDDGPGHT